MKPDDKAAWRSSLKTLRWVLATYLPMPAALALALENGTVRTASNEGRGTIYFIAPGTADRDSIRRAIAQRKWWELLAVCALGIAIGTAAAGIVEFISMWSTP